MTEVVQAPVQEQPAPQDNEQVSDATAAEAVTQAQPESVQEQVAQESTEINEETFINNLIDELENPTEEVNEETLPLQALAYCAKAKSKLLFSAVNSALPV